MVLDVNMCLLLTVAVKFFVGGGRGGVPVEDSFVLFFKKQENGDKSGCYVPFITVLDTYLNVFLLLFYF